MSNDLLQDLQLDDRAGPARPISDKKAQMMIASALRAAGRPKRRLLPVAAAVFAAIIAPTAVAAWWVVERMKEPSPPPKTPPVAPQKPPMIQASPKPITLDRKKRRPKRKRAPQAERPEDLLAKANALRGARAWAKAKAAYLKVVVRHPKTSSAYIAQVAAASIALEQLDDPKGALKLLTGARRAQPQGPLDAEILWAKSRAHRHLGQKDKERSALRALIDTHPDTPPALPARQRMKALNQP